MILISNERWKIAQKAEKDYSNILEKIELPTKSQFMSNNFDLDSDFFYEKGILEIGCSPAAEVHFINDARFKVGLDPLTLEWKHLYRNGTNHIQGIGEYLPFNNKTFDVVLCLNVLDHVKSPHETLKEIKRVFKEEGILLLWLHTYSIPRIIRKKLNLIDIPHPHHFNDKEVLVLIHDAELKIVFQLNRKININSAIRALFTKNPTLLISNIKHLMAILLLGLNESSYIVIDAKK